MSPRTNALKTVEGVVLSRTPAAAPSSLLGVVASVAQALNPLFHLGQAYSRTLEYRLEVRRLEVEQQRLEAESQRIGSAIEKAYLLKCEELAQRRAALDRHFTSMERELEGLRLDREVVRTHLDAAYTAALAPGLALEERRGFVEIADLLQRDLSRCAKRQRLMLEGMRAALPAVQTQRLLPAAKES